MKYILAFDQGTTSSRSIIFDLDGRIAAISQREFPQIYPRPGWVEHDAEELWQTQLATAEEVVKKVGIAAKEISAIGITNQRETSLIWERSTGLPVTNAIVWQDRRTSELCDGLRVSHGEMIRRKTGLEVDAYFSASKIKWMLDHIPGLRSRAKSGELAFGTVDSWLVWRLTDGRSHITDASNASRTMLFNINTLEWDDELLKIFDVPRGLLPTVQASSAVYGEVQIPGVLRGITLASIVGDQQAALYGQACFDVGGTKNTYGTGCFMLQNTGQDLVRSNHRLLSTVAWQVGGRTTYALEGSVFIGGAVVQWLRDSLGIIRTSSDVEALVASAKDNGGVYFVPGFAGLGTPHWDQRARGMIIGLTRGTGREHIARAAVESIAFQTADLLDAMSADSGIGLEEMRVDGGAVRNDALMQFQADMLQIPVARSAISETTALGAAYLAGLAVGVWNSQSELAEHWQAERIFEPLMPRVKATEMRAKWKDAVRRSLGWAEG